jgi:flagellin-specific chaperone FliS
MRIYEYGYPKRKFFETPIEYAEKLPETNEFAQKLIELKFRTNLSEQRKEEIYQELLKIYKKTLQTLKPKDLWNNIKFILTLKGIFYRI